MTEQRIEQLLAEVRALGVEEDREGSLRALATQCAHNDGFTAKHLADMWAIVRVWLEVKRRANAAGGFACGGCLDADARVDEDGCCVVCGADTFPWVGVAPTPRPLVKP